MPDLNDSDLRQLLVAYLDMLRFQVRLSKHFRDVTGHPITVLDTVVNLEVFVFAERGGTLQQEILNSLDAPRTSVRDSLARLVRSGLVERHGRRYLPGPATVDAAASVGDEFIMRLNRLCDVAVIYQPRQGRNPPM
jgi:hypothetical protein